MTRYEKIVELNDERLIGRLVNTGDKTEIIELAKAGCTAKVLVDYAYNHDVDDALIAIIDGGYVEKRFMTYPSIRVRSKIPHATEELDDMFLHHHELRLRIALAETGRHHEQLMYDDDPEVRKTVARYTKDKKIADALLEDKDLSVVNNLVYTGFYDDLFASSTDVFARIIVARNTKDERLLKDLVYDNDPSVRAEVANRGIGLNILELDDEVFVRDAVYAFNHRNDPDDEDQLY